MLVGFDVILFSYILLAVAIFSMYVVGWWCIIKYKEDEPVWFVVLLCIFAPVVTLAPIDLFFKAFRRELKKQ